MISDSYILVDTCILNNLLSKVDDLRTQTASFIQKFKDSSNFLAVSEFTHHEIFRDCPESKKIKCMLLLDSLITIKNTDERMHRATRLYSLYKSIPVIKNRMNSISDIDVFIGSLIFTDEKPYLLTADYDDFPRPLFREVDCIPIEFKNRKGNRQTIYYYIFQANLEAFVS